MTTNPAPLREFVLAFADDEHLMGQQHTEWIGVAPFLEEDLALSSIGQDELGHAVLLYEVVCSIDGTDPASDTAIDALAYDRGPEQYRSSAFTEYPTTDWAHALVRHWMYDMVEEMRWGLVASSTNTALCEISQRVLREESYHRMHANALLDVLLANHVARTNLLNALDTIGALLPSLLAPTIGESELINAGVLSGSIADLADRAAQHISDRFGIDWTIDVASTQTRNSDRSDHFEPLMTRMREVIDYDLEATW